MTTATLPTIIEGDELIFCDGCGVALTDTELDECGSVCASCHASAHFTCVDCDGTFENDEASTKCSRRCQSCQESRDDEELEAKVDAARDEARELLEALCDDGDLEKIRKAVAALKRLQAR